MLVSAHTASSGVAASVFSQLINICYTHIRYRINEAMMTLKYVSMLFADYSIFRYIYTVPISEICICY